MLRPACTIGIYHVSSPARRLRVHQSRMAAIVSAIAGGEASAIGDILAAVTPGGGKSLLPVIAAARLVEAVVVERVCWVVPRDSLRLQAEEAFADPTWRKALGHGLSIRAGENAPNPCRGLAGTSTTYQAIAAAPNLHLGEMRRHRYLLVVDEVHHLPALSDMAPDPLAATDADEAVGWSRALLPLSEIARLRLLLSGTLERADGRGILWLPYRMGPRSATRQVDLEAPGWAVIGYSRSQALADRAVLPVMFGAMDGRGKLARRRRAGADGAASVVQPLAHRDDASGPVHGAPDRVCHPTPPRSVSGDPNATGGAKAGQGARSRYDCERPGQAARCGARSGDSA